MAVSEWYTENKIPKVRWMHAGGNYKARCILLGLNDLAAILYVHVLDANPNRVVAFADEQMTREIGIMHIKNFEKIAILDRLTPPEYKSLLEGKNSPGMKIGTYMQRLEYTQAKTLSDESAEITEQLRLF